ncbi:MAG: GGDEF domain-containing protein [Candidatus Tectomicrobia bacterium]|uniref:diguanylate cyclase n=1 Tax=Tectimicrobiota bacterium TaxID=2528274 RepID=A0A932I0A7_UNCTE|nr:GGDEF domain-containing protein [Candidatus Tectomicrobia bacterium]
MKTPLQRPNPKKIKPRKKPGRGSVPAKARRLASLAEAPPGELFSILVGCCPDALMAVDQRGFVRYMNPAAERLLQRSAADLIGQPFSFPVDSLRSQEVTISSSGSDFKVAEILTEEAAWGGEKFYVVSLRDVTGSVRMREQLRALSDVDPLTGLLNRRGFFDAAQRQLSLAQRTKRDMTFLFVDLDGLKSINDTHGHIEGDQCLIEVANVLRKTFRQPDILSRYGGDEFAVLAIEAKQRSSQKIIERLDKNLQAHNARKRPDRRISFSLGLAHFNPASPASVEQLIENADERMYQNKYAKKRARSRA